MLVVYILYGCCLVSVFFFKQKTAYEMRISDWSSDVCSSDLSGLVAPIDGAQILETLNAAEVGCAEIAPALGEALQRSIQTARFRPHRRGTRDEIGRASCRERVCQYV